MLKIEHLTKRYGSHTAVSDLSFTVEKGQIYGFLGPNGAGKSTTMNIMTGCLSATEGQVRIDGYDIFEEPNQAKRHIGYLPEQPPLYLNESPAEYLRFVGEAKGLRGEELARQIASVIQQTGIGDVQHRRISALSKGYKQRVGIARALATEPAILLCDEATSALAPQTTESILQLLKLVNREMGVTILPITHQMQVIQKIITAILSLTLALSLSACGGSGSSTSAADNSNGSGSAAPAEKTEIKYSKSQGPYTELFEAAIVPILEKQGYTLTCVETPELLVADQLLNSGEVDVNVEQHTAYAESFNANNDGDLVPIPTVPAGVYSVNHSSLDEISDGAKVAVPNDASNTARCYLMLQKIGWITLDPDVDPSSVTQDDIIENPYNIEFTEMKSLTIPAAIQDFDYVAITGSVVYNAGIDASTALANEDIMDHLVLQVVVKEENKDTDWAKAIVDAYHSDEFKQYMAENNDGLWWIPEELR